MKNTASRAIGLLILTTALTAIPNISEAFLTPFGERVDAVISRGLQHFRNTQDGNGGWGPATGLVILCFLEQRHGADWNSPSRGYVGMTPGDQDKIRDSVRYCIDNIGGFGNGQANAYKTGACLMGLSLYIGTGGPNDVGASRPVLDAISNGVDSLVNAQGNCGTNIGGWHYIDSDSGRCDGDLSTTQFAIAGLAAAAAIYPRADVNLPRVSVFLDNDSNGDGGNAYRPGNSSSHTMTASGAWSARLGRMPTNSNRVQSSLRWLRDRYTYDNNIISDHGGQGTFYHLWAASKAFEVTEDDGTGAPLYSDAIGGVRDPAADGFGSESARWYYDFAYWLTQAEINNGESGNWSNYSAWNDVARDAFSILVLERSLGGVCLLDSDNDGLCDIEDNCPHVPNPDQSDQDNDNVGDVCDNCPNLPNSDQLDADGDMIGDACDDLICAVEGPNDPCDGVDNDCDGTVDEDAATNAADAVECATGQLGNCAAGDGVCVDGVETCLPYYKPESEICDGYDNDCDGLIDEEVRNECGVCDLDTEPCDGLDNNCDGEIDNDADCPDGEVCFEGECRPECRLNECFTIETFCDDETNLCLAPCDGVECPRGETCDLQTGECVDPCATGIQCADGQRCWLGVCEPYDCSTNALWCSRGLPSSCPEADCPPNSCDPSAIDCSDPAQCSEPNGQCFCRDGQCIGSCALISCNLYETCVDGACVCSFGRNENGDCEPDPCRATDCPDGELCRDGECEPDPCVAIDCGSGQYCQEGNCVFDDCVNVVCPPNQECIQTPNGKQCVLSDRPDSPLPERPVRPEEESQEPPNNGVEFSDADAGMSGGSPVPNGTIEEPTEETEAVGCRCNVSSGSSPNLFLWGSAMFLLVSTLRRKKHT